MVKFGTIEFYQKVADWLNNNADWKTKAASLSMNFMYVYSDVNGPDGQPKAFLFTITNGKITASVGKAADLSTKEIEFGSTGTYANLAGVAKGELDGQKVTKLKINMMKAIKNRSTLEIISSALKAISKETQF